MDSVWIITLENTYDPDVGLGIEGVYASEIAALNASKDYQNFGWVEEENQLDPGRLVISIDKREVEK